MTLNNLIIKNLLNQESGNVIFIPKYSKMLIAQSVVSLLNTKNGDILIGVDDERKVIGLDDIEQYAQEIMDFLQNAIVPNPPLTVSVCHYNRKDILLISVWEGAQKPYSFDKKIFVRIGDSSVVATPSDLVNLIRQRKSSEFTWERRPVLAASLLELDASEINLTQKETKYDNKDVEEFLQYMNLLSNDLPTNACIALFGIEPAKYIPQTRIKLSCFEGESKVDGIKFMQMFEGNIFSNITNIFNAIEVVYPKRQIISGLVREGRYTYPHLAVREGILNAIVHRDYTDNNQIQINIYSNRLEIINPGILPEGITVNSLAKSHPSVVRNPDIAHCCLVRKYVEIVGSGTLRMISECKKYGYDEPIWNVSNNTVSVTFDNLFYKTSQNEGVNEGVNEGDEYEGVVGGFEGVTDVVKKELFNILRLFNNEEGLKLKDIALKIGRSTKSVERYLKILKDLSLIEFRGSPRNGKYYLVKA